MEPISDEISFTWANFQYKNQLRQFGSQPGIRYDNFALNGLLLSIKTENDCKMGNNHQFNPNLSTNFPQNILWKSTAYLNFWHTT